MSPFKPMIVCTIAAAFLSAQEHPGSGIRFDAECRLTFALPSLTKVTNQRLGGGVGVGVLLPSPFPKEQCEGFRVGLNANAFPGTLRYTAKTSLKDTQLTLDAVFPCWWKGTSWFLGFSANRYSASNSGSETWRNNPLNSSYSTPVDTFSVRSKDTKGVRGGLRLGFVGRLSSHLSATIVFQQTELTQRMWEYMETTGRYTEAYPVNPSWIETGLRYTF